MIFSWCLYRLLRLVSLSAFCTHESCFQIHPKLNSRNTTLAVHDQIECKEPLCQRNMAVVQDCSCGHTDLLMAILHSYFQFASNQPYIPLQDGHTKRFGQRFFARYSWQDAGFLAVKPGYECWESQFTFEWYDAVFPFPRFLITFYHFKSSIVRPLRNLT